MQRTNLGNFSTFVDEIHDISGTSKEFVKKGNFGYCLINDDQELVNWCLSFSHGISCELWIQTAEKYRKQGYATESSNF
ncbi:MAG: hypothetical protein ACFFDT_32510 [Candidatus Hodarchaeota archaeon]